MANHSYIDIEPGITSSEAHELICSVVQSFWGDRVRVDQSPDNPRSWIVVVPDSAASRHSKMFEGEDFGFCIWLSRNNMLEFRHPLNNWEWWAQNKVEQQLAFELAKTRKVVWTDDSTDGPQKFDPNECRDTYRQYITRKFKEPYSEDDLAWFDNLLKRAPEGFRD